MPASNAAAADAPAAASDGVQPQNTGGSFWFVYLVRCSDGTEYCGITTDPEKRVLRHNGELPGGAKYTRSRRPVTLEAAVPLPDRASALRAEKMIKSLPKQKKLARLLRLDEAN